MMSPLLWPLSYGSDAREALDFARTTERGKLIRGNDPPPVPTYPSAGWSSS
ncbi:MAG: hypothetical protein JNK85_04505 [Verrucomicrobiales bacterium]|nr:hypothetical protein [Verrucomicrobiales bacterium]